MTDVSWHAGCPVGLSELRLITLTYRGFDGRDHTGRLIANRTAAATLVAVFRRLYAARFPIRRMEPVDRYGGDDFRSIEADNTSSFNCRAATGSSHWSNHAYGLAIDVNPIENPYVSNGRELAPGQRAVSRPLAPPAGNGVRGRRARRGVPRRRLGLGRQLAGKRPGLPALLGQRTIESCPC